MSCPQRFAFNETGLYFFLFFFWQLNNSLSLSLSLSLFTLSLSLFPLSLSLSLFLLSLSSSLSLFPLVVNCCIRVIRYWFRLLKMDSSRLPYQAYKMLCTLDENGKKNWVTAVRQTLFRLGYGFVRLNQGVATEQHFIAQLKQRFIDVCSQEWLANLKGSTRFDMYILFKTSIKY